MWFFIGFVFAFACLAIYLWKFQTEYFSKALLWAQVSVLGVAEFFTQLGYFDWGTVLPSPYDKWALFIVAAVTALARYTKSKMPETEPQA